MKIKSALISICAVFILLLCSCNAAISSTPTEPILLNNEITPSRSPSTSRISAFGFLELLMLTNNGCQLPCWWGLTPGISKTSDAYSLLTQLTTVSSFNDLGSNQGFITIVYPSNDIDIGLAIDYFPNPEDGSIQLIHINTHALRKLDQDSWQEVYDSQEYQGFLQKFSLQNILLEYGQPAQVWLSAFILPEGNYSSSVTRLTILYPEQGIFIRYSGLARKIEDKILTCPINTFVEFWVLAQDNNDSYQDILASLAPDWEGNSTKIGVMDLQDAAQISIENFYQTYKVPTQNCIETFMKIWPGP